MSSLSTPWHTSLLRRGVVGLAAVATLSVAACGDAGTSAGGSSSSAPSPSVSSTSSAVASSLSSAASGSPTPSSGATSPTEMSSGSSTTGNTTDTTHNDADVTFVQMMIPHHQGAIAMAELVPSRSSSQQVKDLAAQVEAAQAPEIEQMTFWLQAWGVTTATTTDMSATASSSAAGHAGMDHGGTPMGKDGEMGSSTQAMAMPGEMTAEQMQALEAASGADFDRMWLDMMIEHHSGAVEMAQTEIEQGGNPDAVRLAESIRASQAEEIAVMRQLLESL